MYARFAVELAVDFVIMYLVMYTMIASLSDFYPNLDNVYMTLMMVAPMAIVMLVSMRSMFPSRKQPPPRPAMDPTWKCPRTLGRTHAQDPFETFRDQSGGSDAVVSPK